jgi:hypothetical protein
MVDFGGEVGTFRILDRAANLNEISNGFDFVELDAAFKKVGFESVFESENDGNESEGIDR